MQRTPGNGCPGRSLAAHGQHSVTESAGPKRSRDSGAEKRGLAAMRSRRNGPVHGPFGVACESRDFRCALEVTRGRSRVTSLGHPWPEMPAIGRPPAEVWRGGSRPDLAILVAALAFGVGRVGRQQNDAAVDRECPQLDVETRSRRLSRRAPRRRPGLGVSASAFGAVRLTLVREGRADAPSRSGPRYRSGVCADDETFSLVVMEPRSPKSWPRQNGL